MNESILYLAFVAMVATIIINILFAVDHQKAKEQCEKIIDEYLHLIFRHRDYFLEKWGAYPAENGRWYIDLEGGMRIVLYEGKIEGWYKCD